MYTMVHVPCVQDTAVTAASDPRGADMWRWKQGKAVDRPLTHLGRHTGLTTQAPCVASDRTLHFTEILAGGGEHSRYNKVWLEQRPPRQERRVLLIVDVKPRVQSGTSGSTGYSTE